MGKVNFSSLETPMANLVTLLSQEALEKVPGGSVGGVGWWCLNPILVFSVSLSKAEQYVLNNIWLVWHCFDQLEVLTPLIGDACIIFLFKTRLYNIHSSFPLT